jgi:hypothetical protein
MHEPSQSPKRDKLNFINGIDKEFHLLYERCLSLGRLRVTQSLSSDARNPTANRRNHGPVSGQAYLCSCGDGRLARPGGAKLRSVGDKLSFPLPRGFRPAIKNAHSTIVQTFASYNSTE